jgi:hypothetical protein
MLLSCAWPRALWQAWFLGAASDPLLGQFCRPPLRRGATNAWFVGVVLPASPKQGLLRAFASRPYARVATNARFVGVVFFNSGRPPNGQPPAHSIATFSRENRALCGCRDSNPQLPRAHTFLYHYTSHSLVSILDFGSPHIILNRV